MDIVIAPLTAIAAVWLFSILISRPLGMDFSLVRRLLTAVLAMSLTGALIIAITPAAVLTGADFPAFFYVLIGTLMSVVLAMIVLVTAEAIVPSGTLPGPIRIVRATPAWFRRSLRYLRITRILMRHGLGVYVFTRQRPDLSTSDGRRRLARSMAAALDDAGVSFVKLGQILSTRADLLPVEFIEELSALQAGASPVPWAAVLDTIGSELGRDAGEVFASIDAEPLAAASIAQVHTARLHDGREVVIKVQRPRIAAVVASDLDIVGRIARRLERSTQWGRSLGVVALAEGFAASLLEELDFRTEARNITAIATAAQRRGADTVVRMPKLAAGLATRRVLVMERFRGVPVDTAAAGTDRAALARELLDALLGQILVDGVFHADPHPGNILLLSSDPLRVGMLDLGSVGRLDGALRGSLQQLLLALDRDDPAAVVDALLEVVEAPADLDERALQRAMGRFLVRNVGPGLPLDSAVIGDLFGLVAQHGLTTPPELAAVLRALGTIEGTLTRLDPAFDLIAGARDFAARQVSARLEPAALRKTVTDELAGLLPLIRRLPRRVDRIVTALDNGTFTVQVATPAAPTWTGNVLKVLLATAIAATTGVMAALLLVSDGGPRISEAMSVNQLIGYLLLMISAILGLRVLGQVYRRDRTAARPR
ncbi:ABC1 kinase family protein [Pseudonocardia sp. GCM10023141]|uniref:ABC1 kinase family protein n=1 Tax=Pseudonocardia sp. GCM10023141 TaxID=3252653 RepID=UPI00360ACA45